MQGGDRATKYLPRLLPPDAIAVVLSKLRNLHASIVFYDGSLAAEADSERIDNAVTTESISALHIALEGEL